MFSRVSERSPVPDHIAVGRQPESFLMTKAIGLFLLLAMGIHIIRPLGLPGLKRRADFWKIAVVAFVLWSAVLLLRP